jgi:hypothetical protein
MSRRVRRPRIGQWYARRDTREVFQVTGLDERARTVEVQTSDGNLDEIEFKQWRMMPVTLVDPPEDWCDAIDMPADDFADPSSERAWTDVAWGPPADPFGAMEAWEDTATEEEIDFLTERTNPEHLP